MTNMTITMAITTSIMAITTSIMAITTSMMTITATTITMIIMDLITDSLATPRAAMEVMITARNPVVDRQHTYLGNPTN